MDDTGEAPLAQLLHKFPLLLERQGPPNRDALLGLRLRAGPALAVAQHVPVEPLRAVILLKRRWVEERARGGGREVLGQ